MFQHPVPLDARRREFIKRLPKAEQHIHLEGAVPWPVVCETTPEPLPEQPDWLAHDYIFSSFDEFGLLFRPTTQHLLSTVEGYRRAASLYFETLRRQNGRYVAVSFAALHALNHGLSLTDVVAALHACAPDGLTVAVYIAFGQKHIYSDDMVETILSTPGIAGIDRHGNELLADITPFASVFASARARHLHTKVHAGELRGPDAIIEALNALGVRRLQHGVRAIEDPALMARLADEGIILDMCPTSNVRLGVVPTWQDHPIRHFIARGIPVTINTDDPALFNITLTDELERIAYYADLSLADLARLQRTAFEHAIMPESTRAAILAEIDDLMVRE